MSLAVGDVVELVRPHAVLQRFGEAAGLFLVVHRVGIGHGGNESHLGAQRAQQIDLFLGLGVRHVDDAAVTTGVADVREPDPGIAGRALDDNAAGAQRAALLVLADHPERGAILDRSARVQELGLAQDLAAGFGRQPLEPDERRVAHGPRESGSNIHVSIPSCAVGHFSPDYSRTVYCGRLIWSRVTRAAPVRERFQPGPWICLTRKRSAIIWPRQ